MNPVVRRLLIACAAAVLSACGGGGGSEETPVAPVAEAASAPTITSPPASTTVTEAQTASFSVVAEGTGPLAYQWQRGGADIAGATSSSYSLAATLADDGAAFNVVVGNSAGTVRSAPAMLTVRPATLAPAIAAAPQAAMVAVGGSATFTATASGTPVPALQWLVVGAADLADGAGSGPLAGATIVGATASTLVLANVPQAADGLQLAVRASNAAGSVTSSPALLSVSAADPVVGPAGATIASADGNVVLAIAAGALAGDATVHIEPTADVVLPLALAIDAAIVARTSYRVRFTGARPAPGGVIVTHRLPAVAVAATGGRAAPAATDPAPSVTAVRECRPGEVVLYLVNDEFSDQNQGRTRQGLQCDLESGQDATIALATPLFPLPAAVEWSAFLDVDDTLVASDMDATGRVAVLYRRYSLQEDRVRILRADGSTFADVGIPGGDALCPRPNSSCATLIRLDAAGVAVGGQRIDATSNRTWVTRISVATSLGGASASSTWTRTFASPDQLQAAQLFSLALGPGGDVFIGGSTATLGTQPDLGLRGYYVARLRPGDGAVAWATPTDGSPSGVGVSGQALALGATVNVVAAAVANSATGVNLVQIDPTSGAIVRSTVAGGIPWPGMVPGLVGLTMEGDVPTVAGVDRQFVVLHTGFGGNSRRFDSGDSHLGYLNAVGFDGSSYYVWTQSDRLLRLTGSAITGDSDRSPSQLGYRPYSAGNGGASRLLDSAGNALLVGMWKGARDFTPGSPPGGTAQQYVFIQKVRMP